MPVLLSRCRMQPLEPSANASLQQPSFAAPEAQTGLARILHTCSLSSLNLQSCDWVDGSVVSSLCSSSHMQGLQRLQLHGGPCLGDDEAAQLAVNCTALVSLQLQRCQALTATGVCSIIRYVPVVNKCLSYTACLMPCRAAALPSAGGVGCVRLPPGAGGASAAGGGQQGSLIHEDEEPSGSSCGGAGVTLGHAVVSSLNQQPQSATHPSQREQPMPVTLVTDHAPLVALDMNEKAALRAAAVMPSPIYKPKAVVAGGGQKGTPSLFTFKEEENKEPEPAQKPAWGALLSFLNHQSGAVPS
ncbi:hypothetical protein HaLaN_16611 [Haematococcus lacustris]|uniref:Uncharacterized protein n=1 Tax=Haematococcus lacustris TaxID=44745 RepID=A0A699ZAE8_HAELA|nr:hypothetical protein HaLaN_16611 [Haematococcus lacustris]